MVSLEKEALAKVNLGLGVIDRRSDGYHNIETLYSTIGLKDHLTIEKKGSGITVEAEGPDIPQDQENLAYHAARRTLESGGGRGGLKISIQKNIPAGGGLGGASSNAAAVIRGVNELLELGLDEGALFSVAREIGSDVPFFLGGGAALARGRGDELEFIHPAMSLDLVIVFPGFPISTAWAYSRVDSGLTPEWFDIKILASALEHGDLSTLCRRLYNSFEDKVFEIYPELFDLKREMMASGALGSLLSGSGSCLFGIAGDCEGASLLLEKMCGKSRSVWQTTTC